MLSDQDIKFAVAHASVRLRFYQFDLAASNDQLRRETTLCTRVDDVPTIMYYNMQDRSDWYTYPITGDTLGQFIDGFDTMLRIKYSDRYIPLEGAAGQFAEQYGVKVFSPAHPQYLGQVGVAIQAGPQSNVGGGLIGAVTKFFRGGK